MTYETKVGIEIAGIRRSLRIEFKYEVKTIKRKPAPVHGSATVLCQGERLPGDWVFNAMGPRQLEELDRRLVAHWKSGKGKAA
jgi:hypothetical protein